jgi:hypothetical protein
MAAKTGRGMAAAEKVTLGRIGDSHTAMHG